MPLATRPTCLAGTTVVFSPALNQSPDLFASCRVVPAFTIIISASVAWQAATAGNWCVVCRTKRSDSTCSAYHSPGFQHVCHHCRSTVVCFRCPVALLSWSQRRGLSSRPAKLSRLIAVLRGQRWPSHVNVVALFFSISLSWCLPLSCLCLVCLASAPRVHEPSSL